MENSAVPAQTPPLKGTVLFSLATVVAYGGERVNPNSISKMTHSNKIQTKNMHVHES